MQLYAVKINGITNPIGYLLDTVHCSWKVRNARGAKQKYAKIEVSLSETFADILYVLEGDLSALGTKLDMQLAPHRLLPKADLLRTCFSAVMRVRVNPQPSRLAQTFTVTGEYVLLSFARISFSPSPMLWVLSPKIR